MMTWSYTVTTMGVAKGYFDVDGVALDTPAWTVTKADDVFASPPLRGDDWVIPGADGVREGTRRPTVAPIEFELAIFGDADWSGARYGDPMTGLLVNQAHLLEHVAKLPGTATNTRVLTFHFPAGTSPATWVATCHVERLRFARTGPYSSTGQLSLTLPAGGGMFTLGEGHSA